jgi:hypothetical protein
VDGIGPSLRSHAGEGFGSGTAIGAMRPWVDRFELIYATWAQAVAEAMTALLVVAQRRARRWRMARPERETHKALGAPPPGPPPGHWRARPITAASRTPQTSHSDKSLDWVWGSTAGMGEGRRWHGAGGWDGRVEHQPDPERTGRESRGKTWLGRGAVDLAPKRPVARRDLRLVAQDGLDGRSDRRTGVKRSKQARIGARPSRA